MIEGASNYGLIAGRHQLPVDEYIFENDLNPMDFEAMDRVAKSWCIQHYRQNINLYVTGLTAATAAVIKYCVRYRINLTLMHYNRDTGEYVPQDVL